VGIGVVDLPLAPRERVFRSRWVLSLRLDAGPRDLRFRRLFPQLQLDLTPAGRVLEQPADLPGPDLRIRFPGDDRLADLRADGSQIVEVEQVDGEAVEALASAVVAVPDQERKKIDLLAQLRQIRFEAGGRGPFEIGEDVPVGDERIDAARLLIPVARKGFALETELDTAVL